MALNDYDNLIVGAANQYNVDPQLLKSVMSVESQGNPNAYNRSSGATGLLQFIPSTAQERGVLPTDPISSVYGGAAYLNELLTKYGNVDAALQHYSGGGGAGYAKQIVDAYHTVPPPIAPAPATATSNVAVNPNADASGPWWAGMVHQPNFAERQPGVLGAGPGFNPSDPAWQAQHLVQIPVYGRTSPVTVNAMAADSFSGFLGDLAQRGYPTPDVQGFNARAKTGGSGLSAHAYGNAIDINPAANPYEESKLTTNLPSDVSELAAKWGLTWGGDWDSPKDPMHFEWAGVNPTTGVDYRSGKPVTLVRNDGASPGVPAAPSGQSEQPVHDLSPEEQQLYGTGKMPPASPPGGAAAAPASTTTQGLTPEEHALYGAQEPPAPAPAPAPVPTPPPAPIGAPAAPIYTAPATPLIRPQGDVSGYSADAQQQIQEANAPMPAPTGVPVPAITPENYAAFAGFSHGARQAVNPFLEFGSKVGNYLADRTGADWLQTNRVANDLASEQAFQQQYGGNKIAQGAATGARVGVPFVVGGAVGNALRLGLTAANLPTAAEFVSGGYGVGRSGVLPWLGRLASGATAGGIQGMATGGPQGALVGAGLGATVLPAAGAAADWLTGRTAGGAASQAVGAIYRAAQRDGMTPAQLDAAIANLGPQATLADVGGANLRALAEGTANAPGPGSETAWRFLQQRAEGQSERMTQAVRDATGATGSAFDNKAALDQARATAAAPLYQNAFDNTVVAPAQAQELQRFIATPIGQRALQNGLTDIQLEQEVARGQPVDLSRDYGVVQNADGSYELQPGAANLRLYDAVKRGYDSLVEKFRDPTSLRLNLSGTTSVPGLGGEVSGTTLNDIRTAYTGTLRRLFPQYGDALDAWAGPSADKDALSLGMRVLSTDADQTAANVAKLTPGQMQSYQVGVAQALRDRIEGAPDAADTTRRVFGNTQIRNRIAAGFGGEATPAFQNFQATMQREALFADTNRTMLAGSPTARRTAAIQEAQNPPLSVSHVVEPVVHMVSGGGIPGAILSLARGAANPLLARALAPSDLYSQAAGNMLFNPNFSFAGLPPGASGTSIRNLLMGPIGQQAVQFLTHYPQRLGNQ